MPSAITVRGLIEPVKVEDNFMDIANSFNIAAGQGKEFVMTRTEDGDNILFKLGNILCVQEIDTDDSDMLAGIG